MSRAPASRERNISDIFLDMIRKRGCLQSEESKFIHHIRSAISARDYETALIELIDKQIISSANDIDYDGKKLMVQAKNFHLFYYIIPNLTKSNPSALSSYEIDFFRRYVTSSNIVSRTIDNSSKASNSFRSRSQKLHDAIKLAHQEIEKVSTMITDQDPKRTQLDSTLYSLHRAK